MPRFLAFAKLSILRHVAYAYGVLLRTCSLCRGVCIVFVSLVVAFYFDVLLYSFY